jgi:hypothetical protein
MNETELERMIVRLIGDGSGFQKMIDEAREGVKATQTFVENASKKVEEFGSSIKGFFEGVVSGIGALGVGALFKRATDEYGEAAAASRRLNTAIQVNSRDLDKLRPMYEEFATGISKITTVSNDSVIAMLAQAETMNVSGGNAERAVQNAIAAAAAYPQMFGSAQEALRATIALEQGNSHILSRAITELRGIHDPTEQAAKAQEILGRNFAFATQNAQLLSGRAQMLSNEFNELLQEYGKLIKEFTAPVKGFIIDRLREVVAWFRGMSDEGKRAILLVASLGAGFLGLGPIIATVTKAWSLLSGVVAPVAAFFGAVSWPIIAAIAVVGTVVAVLVQRLGGIGKTWDYVREKGAELWDYVKVKASAFIQWVSPAFNKVQAVVGKAWDWISQKTVEVFDSIIVPAWNMLTEAATETWDYVTEKWGALTSWFTPIWDAVIGVAKAAWGAIQEASGAAFEAMRALWDPIVEVATAAWDAIRTVWDPVVEYFSDLWKSVFGTTSITWDSIKKYIVETLWYLEFSLKNWKDVAEYNWTSAQYSAIRFGNQIHHLFTEVIPATLVWFGKNWRDILTDVWNWTITTVKNLGENIYKVFSNIPALIRGSMSWQQVMDSLAPLQEGFERRSETLILPDRVEGDLERRTRELVERQGGALDRAWDRFREDKGRQIDPIANPDAVREGVAVAATRGREEAEAFTKEAKKEMQKFDAALVGSAEAASRIQAYIDSVHGLKPTTGTVQGQAAAGAAGAAAIQAAQMNQAGVRPVVAPGNPAAPAAGPAGVAQGAVANAQLGVISTGMNTSVGLLREIRDLLKKEGNPGNLEVELADAEGI